jgi:hypothetical protein
LLVAPLRNEGVLAWGSYFVLVSPRAAERPIIKQFVAWLHDEVSNDARETKLQLQVQRGRKR